jgi:uncharacterized protein with GYD domain
MFLASYTTEGAKGLKKGGGSARHTMVKQLIDKLGGKLEGFYFAFGDADVVIIADLPDHASAAGISMAVNSGGGATTRTVVLLTPDELDAASKKQVDYRPPGA